MLCSAVGYLILYSHTYPEIKIYKDIQLPGNALSLVHCAKQLAHMTLQGYRHEFLYVNVILEVGYIRLDMCGKQLTTV